MSGQTIAAAENRRNQYLFNTLGLNHDPFAFSSAELELTVNSEDPPFFSYFVDLPIKNNQDSLLATLKQPGHAILYGAKGSGKTTFRYALEAQCRALTEDTLVISHPIGKSEPNNHKPTSDKEATLTTFIEAVATDLFVQTLEQFDTLIPKPDIELTTKLSCFWHQYIPNFHRSLERHLQQRHITHTTVGISTWWRIWKRHVIRYTPLTPDRIQFLQQILASSNSKKRSETISELDILELSCDLSQQLGYQQVYYLVDVADNPQLDMEQLIRQFQDIANWVPILEKKINFLIKFFLPERLKPRIENHPVELLNPLILPSFSAIMQWQDRHLLQTLITNRFRSAGSWIQGIEVLASQEILTELPEKLIEIAHHSPRRLLQIINNLITIHADRDPDDPTISREDWQQCYDFWSDDPLYAPPVMT